MSAVISHRVLLVILLFSVVSAHADDCHTSVALLGNESDPAGEAPREVVVTEIADLYSAALNERALMEAAVHKMQQFARSEGRSFDDVMREMELLTLSPSERLARVEERRAHREEEQLRLLGDLEPYLAGIGRDHRKIIEKTLILPGLVNPLSTGEVGFRFRGRHGFVVGDEGVGEQSGGTMQRTFFGRGDDFVMGQVPVTQLLFLLVALAVDMRDSTPSQFKTGHGSVVLQLGGKTLTLKPNHPVENVSYDEAKAYAFRASKLTGLLYFLPTEAQWEFSSRAGSAELFHFGDDLSLLPKYGWFVRNSGEQTNEVGQLLPNRFQLFDTHGNVAEWTSVAMGQNPVYMGGGWRFDAQSQRSGHGRRSFPGHRHDFLGFRLARRFSEKAPTSSTFVFGESGGPEVNRDSTASGSQ
jgi:hypothetical protein